ncbi:hypothetical protein ACFOY8_13535 [Thalassospira xianhensis]|uniref:Uncharacterized protein n=1 Tax=Thalassospira xianhensis MCCC 1A02616 TaxID=1177929 RepID=A0A367UJH0_9PROT|nr:hypothetical protein [Thalassospira xianhensis]RCK07793.1 hypothetical protein TH5_01750 [Thalassospira xianhensis MCCC 1A02616]
MSLDEFEVPRCKLQGILNDFQSGLLEYDESDVSLSDILKYGVQHWKDTFERHASAGDREGAHDALEKCAASLKSDVDSGCLTCNSADFDIHDYFDTVINPLFSALDRPTAVSGGPAP